MKNFIKMRSLVFCGFCILLLPSISLSATPSGCLSSEEAKLVTLVNRYRNDHGLPSVPVSKSLTSVAQWHVIDLNENHPDTGEDHGYSCNMHSWSDAYSSLWQSVCYTSDHAYAEGMWNKPREITNRSYSGNGYEIAYWTSVQATASDALDAWKSSSGHNDVILEQDNWEGDNWPAMGVAIYQHYAVVWFGDEVDPAGIASSCQVAPVVPIPTPNGTKSANIVPVLQLLLD